MKQILVVEDNPDIRTWLVECLRRVPYDVVTASDGNAGYALAKREDIDLILLDHMLPGKTGREVCRNLRREGIKTPVLMLTSEASQTDKVLTLGMGADDYLTKPFEMRELLARISTLLKRKDELDSALEHAAELSRELETARHVQQKLFPKKLPVSEGWEFAATCRPAGAVGGDYYDLFEVAPGKILIALGDVSGKGLGASLLMAGVQATIRSRAEVCLDSPFKLIAEVNRNVLSSSSPEDFLSLFLGVLDLESGCLTYLNCGHPPPLLMHRGALVPEKLVEGGLLLGVMESSPYSLGNCTLNPGDVLIVFSDGVTEAANKEEEMFEEDRLLQLLQETPKRSAPTLLDEMPCPT